MTAFDVFERAMHLSDNGAENASDYNPDIGETDTSDNEEYKLRTLAIINVLIGELFPYSDTYTTPVAGKRPVPVPVSDFETDICLDDYCAGTVLPYGLAANLFTDENPSIAGFYEQRYEELLNRLRSGEGMPSGMSAVEDAYGPVYYDESGELHHISGYFPYNEFGRW